LPTIGVLTGMGLLVLLIACTNIAGLMLVRGVARRGEIAVRLALGATRVRIVRLLLVENLVLAFPAAILGVALAQRGIPVLVDYAEQFAAPQRLRSLEAARRANPGFDADHVTTISLDVKQNAYDEPRGRAF